MVVKKLNVIVSLMFLASITSAFSAQKNVTSETIEITFTAPQTTDTPAPENTIKEPKQNIGQRERHLHD